MAVNGTSIATLHILNKPPSHNRFLACLDQLGVNDAVFLLEDAVLALQHPRLHALPAGVKLYALEADVRARGLTQTGESCPPIGQCCDMAVLVGLTEQFSRITNW